MHALVVVAHPEPKSLSRSVAAQVTEGISEAGTGHSFEIADLGGQRSVFERRVQVVGVVEHDLEQRRAPLFDLDHLTRRSARRAIAIVGCGACYVDRRCHRQERKNGKKSGAPASRSHLTEHDIIETTYSVPSL